MIEIENIIEYPLAKAEANVSKIIVETSCFYTGSFYIKNVGGKKLKGKVFSDTKCISFEPKEFEGNNVLITYSIDTSIYLPGDFIKAKIIAATNGGELKIPLFIKVKPDVLETKDKVKIYSVKDFFNYVKKNPIDARRLLYSDEFLLWLKHTGFEHMDILETFIKDTNKERALDNFLMLLNFKKKASIITKNKKNEHRIKSYDNSVIEGNVILYKNGSGYIERNIKTQNSDEWIKCDIQKVSSRDFDKNNEYNLKYFIDCSLIKNKYNAAYISIGEDEHILIEVLRENDIKINLSKETFDFNDEGIIFIENDSGSELMVEVDTDDNFIKFEGKRYLLSKRARINFKIKFTALQLTQFSISKRPFVESKIYLKVIIGDSIIKNSKKIVIGKSYI